MQGIDEKGKYYRLLIPVDSIEDVQDFFKNAEHFFTAIHNVVTAKFSFELYLSKNRLNFYIWLEDPSEFDHFFHLLSIIYPSFNHQFIYSDSPEHGENSPVFCRKIKIEGFEFEPFIVFERKDSVLEHVVRLLLKSNKDCEIGIQFLFESTYLRYPVFTIGTKKYESVMDFVTREHNKLIDQYEYKIKCAALAFRTQITVTVREDYERAAGSAILESLKTAFEKGGNHFSVKKADFNNVLNHKFERAIFRRQVMIPRELAQFALFPCPVLEKAGIAYPYFSISRAPIRVKDRFDITIGKSMYKNFEDSKLTVNLQEGEHTALFGETGYGKSTFLINAFLQSLDRGATLIFLDPVGNSVKEIISKMPAEHLDDIVYIAPTESPIGINLLEIYSNPERDIVVSRLTDDIILTLKSVTEAKSGIENGLIGTKIEDILKHIIIGLTEIPRSTFIDISYILNREHSRSIFKNQTRNIHALDFIEDYDKYTPLDLNSTRRIVNYVKTDNTLRRMVCTRTPKFSLEESINKKKIILINGERGKVGLNASSFLLSAYLTKIWIYAQFRKEKDKIMLFADEFHGYVNLSFSDILVTGRKENLSLYLSTTNTNLLNDTLISSIMSNVKNLVLFKLSSEDSEKFKTLAKDVDLTKLTRLVAFVKTDEKNDLVNINISKEANNLNLSKVLAKNSVYVAEDDSLPSIFLNLEVEYFELFQNLLDLQILNKNSDFYSLYWIANLRAQKINGNYLDQKEFYDLLEDCLKNKMLSRDSNLSYAFTDYGFNKFLNMIPGDRDTLLKIYRHFTGLGFICSLPSSREQNMICSANDHGSENISKLPLLMILDGSENISAQKNFTPVYVLNKPPVKQDMKDDDAYFFDLSTSLFQSYKDYRIESEILEISSDLFLVASEIYKKYNTSTTRIYKYLSKFFPDLPVKNIKDILEPHGIIRELDSVKLNREKVKVLLVDLDQCRKYAAGTLKTAQYRKLEEAVEMPLLFDVAELI